MENGMRRWAGRVAALAGVFGWLVSVTAAVGAVESRRAAEVFDQARVEELIAGVDEERNADRLKVQYFSTHRTPVFPRDNGFQKLTEAAAKAEPGSRRWFALESVIGWGAFRADPLWMRDGYGAYNAILDKAGAVSDAGVEKTVEQAIYDLCVTLQSFPAQHGPGFEDLAPNTLLKALQVHLDLMERGVPARVMPWRPVMTATRSREKAFALLEEKLQHPGKLPAYQALLIHASIIPPTKPEESLALLKQARVLIPLKVGESLQLVDREMAPLLAVTGDLAGAIRKQQEEVRTTGHGWGKLVEWESRQGYKTFLPEMVRQLSAPGADEGEVLDAGDALVGWSKSGETAARDAAVEVLKSYLAAKEPREIEQEIHARMLLAQAYLDADKPGEARGVLDGVPADGAGLTGSARVYWQIARSMAADLAKANGKDGK